MSPSRILGFRQSTWVVFFLLTVPIWSMFGYQLLLIILNLITTMFFRIPLEKLLPKDSFVLSEYWMNLHLPLWGALFFVKNISCWRRFRSAYLLTAFRHAYRKYIDREQLFLSGWFEKLGISKKVKGSSGNLNPWIHLLDDEGESFLQELSPVQAFLLIEWTMSKIPFDCSTAPDAGNR